MFFFSQFFLPFQVSTELLVLPYEQIDRAEKIQQGWKQQEEAVAVLDGTGICIWCGPSSLLAWYLLEWLPVCNSTSNEMKMQIF